MSVHSSTVRGMAVLGGVPEGYHPVAEAVDAAHVALDGVGEVPMWSLPDDTVADLLKDVHRLEGRLAELSSRLLAELDRRHTSEKTGATSTRAWLRRELRLAPSVAKQRMVLTAALVGAWGLPRPRLRLAISAVATPR
jgi:hypothetical protein